jgi:cyclic pyranopterin phosphate synthase
VTAAPQGTLLDLVLGYDCNLACDYCTITPEMRRRNMTTDDVRRRLREGRERGCTRVAFTGGEPTIRDDLVPLIEEARAMGFSWVKLQSNAVRFAYPKYVERVVRAGVDVFHVTVSHTDDARRDRMTRVPGSAAASRAGLDALLAGGADVVCDVIVEQGTAPALPDTVAALHRRGARRFHLWLVSLTDGNRENVESLPRIREIRPALEAAFRYGRENGLEILSLHVPRCMLPGSEAHVWDVMRQDAIVSTPEATFALCESRLSANAKVDACRRCVYDGTCSGVRRDYLERFGDEEIVAVTRERSGT